MIFFKFFFFFNGRQFTRGTKGKRVKDLILDHKTSIIYTR